MKRHEINVLETARELIKEGWTEAGMGLIREFLKSASEKQDEAYYLLGNAYRKQGNWQEALNNYTCAIEYNPKSPAAQARIMAYNILDFYNRDVFNH